MFNNNLFYNTSLSLNFGKYALKNACEHLNFTKKNIISKGFKKKDGHLLENNPNILFYNMFGPYDVVVLYEIISLDYLNKHFANTWDFGERSDKDFKDLYLEGSFHHISGFTFKQAHPEILPDSLNKAFIGIVELKLNNGFLFSGGVDFVKHVVNKINSLYILNDQNYRLIYSFSSYELILILFSDDLVSMNKNIQSIRDLKILNLDTNKKIDDGFFDFVNFGNNNLDINNYNIFSDTESYYGVRLDNSPNSKWKICETGVQNLKNEGFSLVTEWRIKPAHFTNFTTFIKDELNFPISEINQHLKQSPGKVDYIYNANIQVINYLKIFNIFIDCDSKNNNVTKNPKNFIRSITTSLEFKVPVYILGSPLGSSYPHSRHRDLLSFSLEEIEKIYNSLKINGVNEQMRFQFLKMFINYNDGIQNTLMFNLYIDLYKFLDNVKSEVTEGKHLFNTYVVSSIHNILEQIINRFDTAYNLRQMHNFYYHKGSEVFVTYNSSLNNLVSDIDSLFKVVTFGIKNLFSLENDHVKNELPSIIATVNYMNSVSDINSVNFEASSIFHPGLLFNLMSKEVFVSLFKDPAFIEHLLSIENALWDNWKQFIERLSSINPLISEEELFTQSIFEKNKRITNYIIIDYLRFREFFNSDFKIFAFWHIATITQSSKHYLSDGTLYESALKFELFRLVIVYYLSMKSFDTSYNLSIHDEFINKNPFDRNKQLKNHLIWHNISKLVLEFGYEFFTTPIKYDRIKTNLNAIMRSEWTNLQMKNASESERENKLNAIKAEVSDLSHYLKKVIADYLKETATKFNFKNYVKVNSIGDNSFLFDRISESQKNDNFVDWQPFIISDSEGGLWFVEPKSQKIYNEYNFNTAILLSEIAYKYKLLSFKCYILEKTK